MSSLLRAKQALLVAAMTALLALSGMALVGCGGSSDSAEPANDAAEKPIADATASDESEITSLKDLEAAMSEAYMGMTDSGEGFYYASSADGSLCIVMAAEKGGDVVSFVGPATTNGNMVTVTDIENELSLTFEVQPQDDGTLMLDMGDLGKAQVAPCKVSEVLEAMDTLDTYGNAVA